MADQWEAWESAKYQTSDWSPKPNSTWVDYSKPEATEPGNNKYEDRSYNWGGKADWTEGAKDWKAKEEEDWKDQRWPNTWTSAGPQANEPSQPAYAAMPAARDWDTADWQKEKVEAKADLSWQPPANDREGYQSPERQVWKPSGTWVDPESSWDTTKYKSDGNGSWNGEGVPENQVDGANFDNEDWYKLNEVKIDWDTVLPTLPKKIKSTWKSKVTRSDEEEQALLEEHSINLVKFGEETPPRCVFDLSTAGFEGRMEYVGNYLKDAMIDRATPIQAVSWPIALEGRDIIGISETGQGKTLAYAIPGFIHLLEQDVMSVGDGPIVLVLLPTRELVVQVAQVFDDLCEKCPDAQGNKAKCVGVYGGLWNAQKQDQEYRLSCEQEHPPEIIVATAGRLMDMLFQDRTNLRRTTYFVVDEVDLMVEKGNYMQVIHIAKHIRPDRQTLFFTATCPKAVKSVQDEFVKDPVVLCVGEWLGEHAKLKASRKVDQLCYEIAHDTTQDWHTIEEVLESQKFELLETILNEQPAQPGKTLIFCNARVQCEDLCEKIKRLGMEEKLSSAPFPELITSFHGGVYQEEREQRMGDFKKGHYRIMIATDVAARGLDISDLQCVIQWAAPNDVTQYIHRLGRAGHTPDPNTRGTCHTFVDYNYMWIQDELIEVLQLSNQFDEEKHGFIRKLRANYDSKYIGPPLVGPSEAVDDGWNCRPVGGWKEPEEYNTGSLQWAWKPQTESNDRASPLWGSTAIWSSEDAPTGEAVKSGEATVEVHETQEENRTSESNHSSHVAGGEVPEAPAADATEPAEANENGDAENAFQ